MRNEVWFRVMSGAMFGCAVGLLIYTVALAFMGQPAAP